MSEKRDSDGRANRRVMGGSALLLSVGLALAGTVDATIGGVAIVAGWCGLLLSIHQIGRSTSARN